jgi:type IV secretion system protein VirB11
MEVSPVVPELIAHNALKRHTAIDKPSDLIPPPLFCKNILVDTTIRQLLGEGVCAYLAEPNQELSANFEQDSGLCRLFIDDGSGPMRRLNVFVAPSAIIAVTRMLATVNGQSLSASAPFLSCELASGFRWHSALAPVSDGPQFSIRVHPRRVRLLSDFMTPNQERVVETAILQRLTMLIVGATFTGKTSLANAVINLIPRPERLLVIEDTHELQLRPGNVVRRFATKSANLRRHVFEALRDRPDRLIIGEVRGPEALAMLDAAVTGHPGLSTIHADSCDEALTRLQRLAGCEAGLVREAIDLVLLLQRFPDGRRAVSEIKYLGPKAEATVQTEN